jgi:signal transduction histidine kinase
VSISLRAQILTAAFVVALPVGWLMYASSSTTYAENQAYVHEEEARMAALVTLRLVEQPGAQDRIVAETLAVLPADSQVRVGPDGQATVSLPASLAWARTWPIYRRNYTIVVGVSLTSIVVVFLLARRWRRGLRALELQARRVGEGDSTPVPAVKMPSSELVSLQASFTEMERNLVSLQRQVVRQERLAAIGTLVSGIAHELNNPLQAIAGRAQLLARDTSVAGTARTDLDLIQKESARASVIIRNLARFSRQDNVAPGPIRLTDVIAAVVELRQHRLDELGVHLVVDDASRARFLGVLPEFQQVVLNFVVNAEQAMASMKRGQRMLTLRTRDLGPHVYCEVEDTGPGVPVEHEPKLFQPFFTTKPVGEGTGLGLSVSYGIIESYGGRIGYRRADSGGAILWFDVPAIPTT